MILEYLGLEFHGISILQSISLEDLIYNFKEGQGWPKKKQDVKFGIFHLIFQMLVYPFYSQWGTILHFMV